MYYICVNFSLSVLHLIRVLFYIPVKLVSDPLATLLATLKAGDQRPHEAKDQDQLVREAAQGHLDAVKGFVDNFPDNVSEHACY